MPPFRWELFAFGDNRPSVLQIAAQRNVRLVGVPRPQDTLVTQVYRIQALSALPLEFEAFDVATLLRAPYWVNEDGEVDDTDQLRGMTFQPVGSHYVYITTGARSQTIEYGDGEAAGDWKVTISAHLEQPSAFVQRVRYRDDGLIELYVVRTENVSILAEFIIGQNDRHTKLVLKERQEGTIDTVPEFLPDTPGGDYSDPLLSNLSEHFAVGRSANSENNGIRVEIRLSREARASRDIMLSFIEYAPGFAPLYNLSNLVFAAYTGRTLLGETIGLEELENLAFGCVLSIAEIAGGLVFIGSALRGVRITANATRLWAHAATRIDPVIARSAAILRSSSGHRREATRILRDLSGGSMTFRAAARELRSLLNRVVEEAVQAIQVEVAINRLFTLDRQNFRDAFLRARFNEYRRSGRQLDALEWAIYQTARGANRNALESALGRHFHKILGRRFDEVLRAARRARLRVSPADIEFFDSVAGRVAEYRELRRLTQGKGHLFEVDHLFERRFWSTTEVSFSDDDIFAMVVPKNAEVATKMNRLVAERNQLISLMQSGRAFQPDPILDMKYVHTVKTTELRRLIPNGTEEVFTTQQWWDAHVHVLRKLGVDEGTLLERLRPTFEIIAESRGHTVSYHLTQTSETFSWRNLWPRVSAVW